MIHHLSAAEHVWLAWHGRLRVARFVGTVGELYRTLTGRPHPKARDRG